MALVVGVKLCILNTSSPVRLCDYSLIMMTWNWPVYIDIKLRVDISRCVKKVPLPLFCSLFSSRHEWKPGRGHRKHRLCQTFPPASIQVCTLTTGICTLVPCTSLFYILTTVCYAVYVLCSVYTQADPGVKCRGNKESIDEKKRIHLYVKGGAITNRHSLLDPYNYV